jgi:hypothetical protein
MSLLGWIGGIVAGGFTALATGNVYLGLQVGRMTMGDLNRVGGTPGASDQGDQREMVLDAQADIPVVYGRAIVAPKIAYVTTSGPSNDKLYLVCVLCEGAIAARDG